MKTLIDRRRAQPFRDYLDSPSWLDEEKPVLRPTREITGKELLRFFAACVLGAVGVWVLLVAWPILERVSR